MTYSDPQKYNPVNDAAGPPAGTYASPLRAFLIVAAAIFMSETIVMGVFHFLIPGLWHLAIILDSLILIIVLFPVLYFFLFRPMSLYISDIKGREKEDRLKVFLLDSATDSIFLHDYKGNLVYVNRAAYERRGYTKEELMGMNLHELDTPEYGAIFGKCLKELLVKGEAVFELAHRRKDGTVMPIEVHARVIEQDGRKLVLSLARDITARRRAEQELRDRLDELERFHGATIKREFRMRELKDRVKTLEDEIKWLKAGA